MNKRLMSLLVCPKCKGKLVYQSATSELLCQHDQLVYPVRDGVPVLLEMDARKIESSDNP